MGDCHENGDASGDPLTRLRAVAGSALSIHNPSAGEGPTRAG
jgi:hypothetical protein